MGKLPEIQHQEAIRAFQRAGFKLPGKVVMPDGRRTIVIPRNNPMNAFTMFGIVKDAGLTVEQFRALL